MNSDHEPNNQKIIPNFELTNSLDRLLNGLIITTDKF